MANMEHLEILKRGVKAWNKWREENRDIMPDLSEADLRGADLRGAILIRADLSRAILIRADLSRADLRGANLIGADLRGAILRGADLSEAILSRADLSRAILIGAILSRADLSRANLRGANLYVTSRDYWKINDVECDYVYWDRNRETRTPDDRDFRPGEFEDLYKWRPLNEFERLIRKSIEFPEEYKQAGTDILNYFGEVLRKKYPDTKASVKIEQDGLKVKMVIDPVDGGKRDVIEKTLNEYGLVITGKMSPEEFTDDRNLIIELKSELRIAQVRIETQKDLLQDKSAQVDKLLSIVGQAVQSQPNVTVYQTKAEEIQGLTQTDKVGTLNQKYENTTVKDSNVGIIGDGSDVSGGINKPQ